jgi:hypothetical protein
VKYCGHDFIDLPQIQERTRWAEDEAEIDKNAAKVILTTASLLEGFRVLETVEIITAEHMYSLSIVEDLFRGSVKLSEALAIHPKLYLGRLAKTASLN